MTGWPALSDPVLRQMRTEAWEEIYGQTLEGKPLFRSWNRPPQELIDYIEELETLLGIEPIPKPKTRAQRAREAREARSSVVSV